MLRGFRNVVSKKTALLRTRWIVKNCLAILSSLLLLGPAGAFNYVTDAKGTWWGIQDAASPRVDTGSIRATQTVPGVSGPYSTSINGFGGIRVLVETAPAPRFNGEIMRGFGLAFDGVNRFATTKSVGLGGVKISRSVYVNNSENWGRWLDTFTNTTRSPITVKVAFGGQSGMGVAGANSSSIVNTSTGDTTVTAADSWVEVATPLADATLVGGPQVTVLGTPSSTARQFIGAVTFVGDWLADPFDKPLTYAGHEANFQAYVYTLTLNPGHSRSLLHFVVLGQMVNAASSTDVRAAVETTATNLAAAPAIGDLTVAEVCSIDNFDIAALTANGFDYSNCRGRTLEVEQPPTPKEPPARTSVKYDVVGKTIQQLRADLESGFTTSVEITQAYLDRIRAYDQGQFGFNAFEVVAENALEQARAADNARIPGASRPLLGIPIGVKNLYDTFDMPTTNGSMTFAGFRPAHDAFQIGLLRRQVRSSSAKRHWRSTPLPATTPTTHGDRCGTCSTHRSRLSHRAAAPQAQWQRA